MTVPVSKQVPRVGSWIWDDANEQWVAMTGSATGIPGSGSVGLRTDVIFQGTTALTPKYAIIDAATSGNNTLVSAVVGAKIRVIQYTIVASAAVTVRFESGADGTAKTGQMQFAANGGTASAWCPTGLFETAVNTLLNLELSGAVSVDGHLSYIEAT